MDFSRYNERIQELGRNVQRTLPEEGKRVFDILESLEKEALATGDASLIGFTYLSYANAYYYRENYDSIRPYLHRAIRYLLHSSDNDSLARAYNLFAVDAQRIGVFDIAYHYFQMAASFIAQDADSISTGLIEGNLGDLMAHMGDYAQAVKHIRKSLKIMSRKKDTFLSRQNSVIIRTNLALYQMYGGDTKGALRQMSQIKRDLSRIRATDSRAHLWFLILRLHAALMSEDRQAVHALTQEVIDRIIRTEDYLMFANEIHRLCNSLVRHGAVREAGRMIDAADKVTAMDESYYARLLHEQVRISYYKQTKNRKRLDEAYAKRHQLLVLQAEERRKVYYDSAELMHLVNDLQAEQVETEKENARLKTEADTDELTGLPNRHALNRVMEEIYDRCKKRGRSFGIGIVDIDAFKYYNDTYGHQQGDRCLQEVAHALRMVADRSEFFVARYGGDEFVLLYENLPDAEIGAIERQIITFAPVPVTHGMFNAVPSDTLSLWDFFAGADAQMYRRKKAGR